MVSFELGKETERDVLHLVTSVGKKKITFFFILLTNVTLSTLLILAVYRTNVVLTLK